MPRNFCQMAIKKRVMTAKVIGYMKPDIDPNTRLYVPFNEGVGSIAKDYSQYNNHATLTDVEWSPDGFNGAGKFNGSSSYGEITSFSLSGNATYAVNFLITDNTQANKRIINYTNGVEYRNFSFGVGNLSCYDATNAPSTIGLALGDSIWHYAVLTMETNNLHIHVDSGDKTLTTTTWDNQTINTNLYLGFDNSATYLDGFLSSIIILSKLPNPAQIAADCYEVVCS